MGYVAGDHVAILPQNNDAAVGAVLTALKLSPDDVLAVETTLPEGATTIPERVTVKQLFSQYLDLNCQPTRNVVRLIRQFCKDEKVKKDLEKILDPSDPTGFNELVSDCCVAEFIQKYAQYGIPPLEYVASGLPLIQPRLYSIASAPEGNPRVIDLVVTDNMFGPGEKRHGLCTAYLKQFGLTKVALHTQTGCFGYPSDQKVPILMAALGCGVAPMLSLLQHREHLAGHLGNAALFFGCRFRNTYPILDAMLENYLETGAMQNLYVAYSRSGATKLYITDLMKRNPDVVWQYWSNPKCEYFYCGPARGIPDELNEILVNISMEKGGMTREEAEAFCNAHPHHVESF
jgi:sulfite reductase alpha subunit-like flavoprotein